MIDEFFLGERGYMKRRSSASKRMDYGRGEKSLQLALQLGQWWYSRGNSFNVPA